MKVVFLIRSLERGGAERQLVTLAKVLHGMGHDVSVAVFYGNGDLKEELTARGIPIVDLQKSGRWDTYRFLWRLAGHLRRRAPDFVYSSLTGANICATGLRPFLPRHTRIVIRIAASYVDLNEYDRMAQISYWIEARLARLSALVIANSHTGARYARSRGFPERRLVVVRNGFDVQYFKRDQARRTELRREWGVEPDTKLIGLVARLDPIKDHPVFLKAVSLIVRQRKDLHFVCVGTGSESYERKLREMADGLAVDGHLIWAGAGRDMPAVYSALDIATCSSYGEGLPNVVGEAMACETPCVVTDVGDAAWVVGETGEVVAPRSPEALARGWSTMLERIEEQGPRLGRNARNRIAAELSDERLAEATVSVLRHLLEGPPKPFTHGPI